MSQTRNQQAYQRGIRVALMWKRLKGTILRWDHRCVSKAHAHKLPSWVGHIPMSMFAVIMLTALVFGGMVIASSAVLVGALVLLVSGALSHESKEVDNLEYSEASSEPSHCFDEDEYVTNSILNDDYDGAPYKSPSGD